MLIKIQNFLSRRWIWKLCAKCQPFIGDLSMLIWKLGHHFLCGSLNRLNPHFNPCWLCWISSISQNVCDVNFVWWNCQINWALHILSDYINLSNGFQMFDSIPEFCLLICHHDNRSRNAKHIDGLVQDCSISSALAMQSCIKPSVIVIL